MSCPHCKMEPIDGVTHHLSRCPMRHSPVEARRWEGAISAIRSLSVRLPDLWGFYVFAFALCVVVGIWCGSLK